VSLNAPPMTLKSGYSLLRKLYCRDIRLALSGTWRTSVSVTESPSTLPRGSKSNPGSGPSGSFASATPVLSVTNELPRIGLMMPRPPREIVAAGSGPVRMAETTTSCGRSRASAQSSLVNAAARLGRMSAAGRRLAAIRARFASLSFSTRSAAFAVFTLSPLAGESGGWEAHPDEIARASGRFRIEQEIVFM